MADYSVDVATKQYQQNLVVKIDSDYFSAYQPDSGLTVDADKVNTVSSLILSPTSVDIRDVNISISSFSFELTDLSGNITTL